MTKFWRGLPYLRKVASQAISVRSGRLFSTPSSYSVLFGYHCNARCIFCQLPHGKSEEIPPEMMMRIVSEARELSRDGFNVNLSGGEPLLYDGLYAALERAHQLNVNMGFTTNGYLLTPENVRKALAFDPFNINVSLESVDPAVNEKLRPMPGGTGRTLAGIDAILDEKRRTGGRVTVFVKPTVTDVNYASLPQLVRHFGKGGDVLVTPQPYYPWAGHDDLWVSDPDRLARVVEELISLQAEGYSLNADAETLRGFVDYFRMPPLNGPLRRIELNGRKRRCSTGYSTMFILPDAKVYLCGLQTKAVGDLHTQSLREIWRSQAAATHRRQARGCTINCQLSCTRKTPLLRKVRSFLQMG
ncbi:MAG: radical SAM protein [Phycisphaerae bacterium]